MSSANPETEFCTRAFLRCKEWFENLLRSRRTHTSSVVGNHHRDQKECPLDHSGSIRRGEAEGEESPPCLQPLRVFRHPPQRARSCPQRRPWVLKDSRNRKSC
jgi:hypothetical protein